MSTSWWMSPGIGAVSAFFLRRDQRRERTLHVAADLLEPLALGRRAHDETGVLDAELLAQVAQAVALALPEAPRDTDAAAPGHVHDVAPGEGDVHGEARALAGPSGPS